MKKRFNSVSLPSHPHIHFSLHHASALVDGLLLMEPTTDKSAISLMNKLRRRGGIHLTGRLYNTCIIVLYKVNTVGNLCIKRFCVSKNFTRSMRARHVDLMHVHVQCMENLNFVPFL